MKLCLDCEKPKSYKGNYCKKCGYKHRIRPKGLKYKLLKHNPTSFVKGAIPWNKGRRSGFRGKTKDGLHDWVERNLGKAKYGVCEKCANTKNMQWSNKSGRYLKKLTDWQRLCNKCHSRYDFEMFGARKKFYR
jgi:hypothetical protein